VASIISNLLAVVKTDASALPPAVRFVPSAFLFVHAEPLPDGMQPSELDGFASVTLEGLAPLPLEQLAWGYLTHAKSRHLLLFGAFNERLNQAGISPEETFFHVLPSFFAAAPANGAAQWVFLWEAGHVAAVHYLAGEVIPARIEIERLTEDTVAAAFAARENLLKHLGTHARSEAAPGLLAQPESSRTGRDRVAFSFAHYESETAEPKRVAGNAPGGSAERWTADLRGNIFRGAEQRRRQASATAGLVLKLAAAFALLLLIGQGTVIYFQYWVKNADAKINDQKAEVNLVDQRLSLLSKITTFTDHELHPFEMLGMINPLRPKQIYYTKTRVYDNNKLSIDCIGTDSAAVSDFVDSLSRSGLVDLDKNKLIIQTNPLANPPTYKFTLNLAFNSVPKSQPMPPPPPEPEPVAEPPTLLPAPDAVGPADLAAGPADGSVDQAAVAPEAQPSVQSGPNIIRSAPPEATNPAPAPAPAADAAPAPAADAAPAPAQ